MAKKKLHNYIKKHRRRLHLTQTELAALMGCLTTSKISRYERYARDSSLEIALTLEILFDTPVSELFAGIYEQADLDLEERIRLLIRKLNIAEPKQKRQRERYALVIAFLENRRNNPNQQ